LEKQYVKVAKAICLKVVQLDCLSLFFYYLRRFCYHFRVV